MWRKIIILCSLIISGVLLCSCKKQDEQVTLNGLSELFAEENAEMLAGKTDAVWQEENTGITTEAAGTHAREPSAEEMPLIYIHVCGAVKQPGVVKLPEGSRALDAVDAAGGFTQDAMQDYVNLAAVVSDGEKLYIPTQEETMNFVVVKTDPDAGLINLNTANQSLLCTLPGIGESRAAQIIAYREANGRFESIEEIMKVAGIKESTFAKMKNLITVK
jgi:competence protein ComEA